MKRFLSQRQNKWLLLAALNKGERNMISYEVGKRYDATIRGEGTQFDLADDGAFLAVYFSRPDEKEVAQFGAENPFEFRFVTLQGIMMCVFRIGSLNWMDAPYTPHLSQNLTKFTLPNEGEGLSLTLSLFDCSNGELMKLRYMSMSTTFTKKFFAEAMDLKMKPFSKAEYFSSLNDIYAKYSTKDLLKLSSPGFKIH